MSAGSAAGEQPAAQPPAYACTVVITVLADSIEEARRKLGQQVHVSYKIMAIEPSPPTAARLGWRRPTDAEATAAVESAMGGEIPCGE